MTVVCKQVIVPYTAKQMYSLVSDVNNYPQFITWCPKTKVIQESDEVICASLFISVFSIEQQLTTRNTHKPYESIDMQLVSGPFQHFRGEWRFREVTESQCNISCTLDYIFASDSSLLRMIAPFFDHASDGLVNIFVKRAKMLYG